MLHILEDAERSGVMSDLERDMLLAELREAYSEVKFGAISTENSAPTQPETDSEADEPEMEVEILFAEEDEEETDVEAVVGAEVELTIEEQTEEQEGTAPVVAPVAAAVAAGTLSAEAAESAVEAVTPIVESVAESVVEPIAEPTTEPTIEPTTEPAVEPVAEPVEVGNNAMVESVPAVEDVPIVNSRLSANKPHRSAILSLYEEAPAIVGEQFAGTTSVADVIASTAKSTVAVAPIASLHGAIGVADKFLLMQDLFGGNAEAYETAISTLDSMPSFDDCVIFISENYTWSPNSEGTKLIMELLQRKYNA